MFFSKLKVYFVLDYVRVSIIGDGLVNTLVSINEVVLHRARFGMDG